MIINLIGTADKTKLSDNNTYIVVIVSQKCPHGMYFRRGKHSIIQSKIR